MSGEFDYNVVATGLIAPVVILLLKALLDLNLSRYFVKYFFWLPVRGLFRDNPQNLSGRWEQFWGAGGSNSFKDEKDRHSYTDIKQFGCYLYSEFDAQGRTYCLFARVRGGYVVGEWYDKKNKHAYFGALQFRVIGGAKLEGLYVGHSYTTGLVGADIWVWNKCA
jgi:hypothetical protein